MTLAMHLSAVKSRQKLASAPYMLRAMAPRSFRRNEASQAFMRMFDACECSRILSICLSAALEPWT